MWYKSLALDWLCFVFLSPVDEMGYFKSTAVLKAGPSTRETPQIFPIAYSAIYCCLSPNCSATFRQRESSNLVYYASLPLCTIYYFQIITLWYFVVYYLISYSILHGLGTSLQMILSTLRHSSTSFAYSIWKSLSDKNLDDHRSGQYWSLAW